MYCLPAMVSQSGQCWKYYEPEMAHQGSHCCPPVMADRGGQYWIYCQQLYQVKMAIPGYIFNQKRHFKVTNAGYIVFQWWLAQVANAGYIFNSDIKLIWPFLDIFSTDMTYQGNQCWIYCFPVMASPSGQCWIYFQQWYQVNLAIPEHILNRYDISR
jgi:hypothetical protein